MTATRLGMGALIALAALVAGCDDSSNTTNNTTPDAGFMLSMDGGPVAVGIVETVAQTDLVSDLPGGVTQDSLAVNSWGLAATADGPWWVANAGTGVATVYDGSGVAQNLVVTIPAPASAPMGTTAAPTGVVHNPGADFGADVFIFATENGTIAGWQTGTTATTRVDNSGAGAVYKGLALLNGTLYAANFSAGTIDRFDGNYTPAGTLSDPDVPAGYAPFNVASLNGRLYVTYAKQGANGVDDEAGPGNGFLDVFDLTSGKPQRLVSNGVLNSPWGMAIAPSNFGAASDRLLVGNFGGDNHINVFNPDTGALLGYLGTPDGFAVSIEGLWSLQVGNGGMAGGTNQLFFTAGPADETHGLFGRLDLSAPMSVP